MKIVAISGSLRAGSHNTAVLRAICRLAPSDVSIEFFDGIGQLPFFNSDLEATALPKEVDSFRRTIGEADGLLISSPEYARGVSGVMKNALDWLVGSHEFPGKPVALINTSPRASHALAALTLTLETMSANMIAAASVTLPLIGTDHDSASIVANPEFADALRNALERFIDTIKSTNNSR